MEPSQQVSTPCTQANFASVQTLTGDGNGLPVTGFAIAGVIIAVLMVLVFDAAKEILDEAIIATASIIDAILDVISISLIIGRFMPDFVSGQHI